MVNPRDIAGNAEEEEEKEDEEAEEELEEGTRRRSQLDRQPDT